jgi:tetratricopeptide (TPR) repeat protein
VGYLKALGRNEDASEVIRELVDAYKLQGDYTKASGHLKDLHEFTPQDNRIKAELADMCLALNIPQDAVNYYAEAALGFREERREREAVEVYRKIIGIDPKEESIREELALLLAAQGEVKEAIEHNLFLVNKHSAENREAENLSIYQRLLALDAGLHDIREKLAAAYEAAGENVSAAEELMTLSSVYEKGGDLKTAIIRALQAKKLVPENDAAIRRLITLYEASGDKESLRIEYIDLGDIFLSRSEPDQAEEYYRKAQKLKPDDISTGELIARLNETRKNYKAACEEYRRIASLYE